MPNAALTGAGGHPPPRRYPFLPAEDQIGWTPYLWLAYLGFLFIGPVFNGATASEWAVLALIVAAFLPIYFLAFWLSGWRLLAALACMCLLGLLYLPHNFGAGGLFIYATAYLGYAFRPGVAVRWLFAIVTLPVAEGLLLGLHPMTWTPALLFGLMVGAVNIHFGEVHRKNVSLHRAQEEVERLAKAAERERIARDLHDLLGHTLTVIAVKSELAAKLASRDPARAAAEIYEVHQISRQALAEVRQAVTGYRAGVDPAAARGSGALARELVTARAALASAGIDVELHGDAAGLVPSLSSESEAVLAFALREAVTNVVRHAGAGRCRIVLEEADGRVRLTVADDGRGGGCDGSGLAGMRERVEGLGGRVARDSDGGTTLVVEVPLAAAARPSAGETASAVTGENATRAPLDGSRRPLAAG